MKRTLLLLLAFVALSAQAQETPVSDIHTDTLGQDYRILINYESYSSFPGGFENLLIYLNSHIEYPEALKKKKRSKWIEGRVELDFEISPRGDVQNVKVTSSPDKRLSKAAMKLISQMPRWKPARKYGRTVTDYYNISIDYNFDSEGNLIPLKPLSHGGNYPHPRKLYKGE